MKSSARKDMSRFLQPTRLCDCGHKAIRATAENIVRNAYSEKDAAIRIFSFVRDDILFVMNRPTLQASRVLAQGGGFCFTKTNLHVALLRAAGIPARCHYIHLAWRFFARPAPQRAGSTICAWINNITNTFRRFLYKRMSYLPHPWPECFINGAWVACEALLDKVYYESLIQRGDITKNNVPTIEWDGKTGLALFNFLTLRDMGTFPSIDDIIIAAKKNRDPLLPTNRLMGWAFYGWSNRIIDRVRKGTVDETQFEI